MSGDISNSYLVTSDEGGLVVNRGNEQNGPIHRARGACCGSGRSPAPNT